jgi:AmiR/NasT family two-component response regulator
MGTTNSPQRALICEDEGMILVQLRNALRSAGFDVVGEAPDGRVAIEKARDLRPDFILMDIKMPRLGGIEAARAILAEQEVPIIVLTAFGDEQSVSRALDAGACAYLVKPVSKEQLIPAVHTAIQQFAAHKKTEREKQSLKTALKETITRSTAKATQETRQALRTNAPASSSAPAETTARPQDSDKQSLLDLTRRLLESIHAGDVETYRNVCTEDLTCYETDVAPYRIDGVEFHVDLMNAMNSQSVYANLTRFDILSPSVQLHGDCAIVTYTRLMTYAGSVPPAFRAFNESRIYVRQNGQWKMAHFHRSEAQ